MSSPGEDSPDEKPQENLQDDSTQNSPPHQLSESEKRIAEPFGKARAVLVSTMIVLTQLVQACTYFISTIRSFYLMHWHIGYIMPDVK